MLIYPKKLTDEYEKKNTRKSGNVKKSERREQGRNLTDNNGETMDNMKMEIKMIKI
jgi:hypothetical protein